MEKRIFKRYLILPLLLSLLAVIVPPHKALYAAPQQQEGNLLNNGGFEQPFVNGTAEGWTTWASQTEKTADDCTDGYHYLPKWNMETGGNFVGGGVTSQYIGNNWDMWNAGVMQTVDATPGTTYRFTFASKGRTANDPSPEPSDYGVNMNIRAGIDPNGSAVWSDSDVVWGSAGSPHDSWQTFTVEAQATGDKITVFTSANLGVQGVNQCRQFLDTWYDNAELVAVDQAPAPAPTEAPAPAATQPPAPTPTAIPEPTTEPEGDAADQEPTAEASPTEEPEQESVPEQETGTEADVMLESGGTICVNAFHDENANGVMDENEGFMAGITITVAGESTVIGQAISDGSDIPTCFHGLAQGPYQVAQQLPGRLEMTTAANALVGVTDNHTTFVTFGTRIRQADSAAAGSEATAESDQSTTPADTAPEGSASPLSMGGLAIILVGVILLGGLLFYLLRR
ncbi:MAG: hypothetical protein ACK2UF_21280 [Candidatus Promineifilaceae bacterium]